MVTADYTAGSVQIQVDNASVFGANGTFASPINATASVGGVTVGTFSLTGRSGNLLLVNTAQSSLINLNSGTVLSASVPITAASSAGAIFPSYINARAQQMALNLVVYFNNFPIKLPAFNAPPHTPTQRGAIQSFIYQQIAGGSPTSLVGSLQIIPLPATSSSDLTIYNQTVLAALEQSRQRVLSGVNQIFSGKLRIAAPQPANRLGTFTTTTAPTTTTGATLAGQHHARNGNVVSNSARKTSNRATDYFLFRLAAGFTGAGWDGDDFALATALAGCFGGVGSSSLDASVAAGSSSWRQDDAEPYDSRELPVRH